jgi:hypothetical protein
MKQKPQSVVNPNTNPGPIDRLTQRFGTKTNSRLGINFRKAAILFEEAFREQQEFTFTEFVKWIASVPELAELIGRERIFLNRGLKLAGLRDDIPHRFSIERVRVNVYRIQTILDATINFPFSEGIAKDIKEYERDFQRMIQGYPLETASEAEIYALLNMARALDHATDLGKMMCKTFEQGRIDSHEIYKLRNKKSGNDQSSILP